MLLNIHGILRWEEKGVSQGAEGWGRSLLLPVPYRCTTPRRQRILILNKNLALKIYKDPLVKVG